MILLDRMDLQLFAEEKLKKPHQKETGSQAKRSGISSIELNSAIVLIASFWC